MKRRLLGFLIVFFLLIVPIFGAVLFAWKDTTLFHSIDCDSFVDNNLSSVFEELIPGSELNWIDEHFLPGQNVATKTNSFFDSGFDRWIWSSVDKDFELLTSNQSYRIRQSWKYSYVTIDDMLKCLGEPDAYLNSVEQGPDALLQTISFFYVQHGYIVSGRGYVTEHFHVIDKDTEILFVFVVGQKDLESMVESVYDHVSMKNQKRLIDGIELWPGDLLQIDQQPVIFNALDVD